MKEIEAFRHWLFTLGYSTKKIKLYPQSIERLFRHLDKPLGQITEQDLTGYSDHLRENFKPTYTNSELTAIRTFSKFLTRTTRRGLPVGHLLYERIPQKLPTYLTEQEVQQLYKVTTNSKYGYRDRAMLSLCYGGGLRRSEAIGLHVQDIDTKRGYVHVRNGKNYKERIVPLPPKAIEDIKQYLKHSRPLLQKGKHYQRELFLGYRGKKITDQVFEKRIRDLTLKTANSVLIAKRPTLHTLRHSIATHLLYRGVSLDQVSRFLGHASMSSTQVYLHIKPP